MKKVLFILLGIIFLSFTFIQFGHNDEKKESPKVYAEAHTDYKKNLI